MWKEVGSVNSTLCQVWHADDKGLLCLSSFQKGSCRPFVIDLYSSRYIWSISVPKPTLTSTSIPLICFVPLGIVVDLLRSQACFAPSFIARP